MFLGMLIVQPAQAEIPDAEIYYLHPYEMDDTLNPFSTQSYITSIAATPTHVSLLSRIDDEPNQLTTSLAVSWTQIDQITYRFELRPDAYFSDGTPVTAESVKRALEMGAEAYMVFNNFNIGLSTVQELDTYTIEVTTTGADFRAFMNIILLPIFHPDSDPLTEDILTGAGPYMIEEDNRPNNVTLVKNEFYWEAPNVLIDRIIFMRMNSPDEAISAINGNDPEWTDKNVILDPQWNLWSRKDEINAPYVMSIDLAHQELSFNLLNDNLNEACERRDISSYIDRQYIIDAYLDGLGIPAVTAWSNDWYGFDPHIPSHPDPDLPGCPPSQTLSSTDPTESYTLSQEYLIDVPNEDMTFLVPNTNPARVGWAEEITSTLNANGYRIDLISADWGYIFERTFLHPSMWEPPFGPVPTFVDGGYDGLFIGFAIGIQPALEGMYDTGGFYNYYNYANPAYDEAWADFVATGNLFAASLIQQILHADEPAAIILRPNSVMFYSDNIGGIPSSLAQSMFYDWTNLYLVNSPSDPKEAAIMELNLLITDIEDMFDTGLINKGQENSLHAKLFGAIAKLQTGNDKHVNTAINKINAFLNEVTAYVQSNKLTQLQADPLINLANIILIYLHITN